MAGSERPDTSDSPLVRIKASLASINSLINKPEDYQRLITSIGELAVVVKKHSSPESMQSNMDLIISELNNDPDSFRLEFFAHALVIDRETPSPDGKRKALAIRIVESLNHEYHYPLTPISKDDSVRMLGFGITSLLDYVDSIQSTLSEPEREMFREKIDKLEQKRNDKKARRITAHMNQIRTDKENEK